MISSKPIVNWSSCLQTLTTLIIVNFQDEELYDSIPGNFHYLLPLSILYKQKQMFFHVKGHQTL